MSDKINVLNNERKYMGEFYDHADQLLDNLEDIKDIFDKYLAAKLYNWRGVDPRDRRTPPCICAHY